MSRWRPLMYNGKKLCWSWRIGICSRGNNWWKLTLIWRIVPMNFEYKFKNWKANWKHFAKCSIKFLKSCTWTIGWRYLNNYFWTMPCLRYRTKHWFIKTQSGRNGANCGGNHWRTNRRQFGDYFCRWRSIFEWTGCMPITFWGLEVWPTYWQIGWGTC